MIKDKLNKLDKYDNSLSSIPLDGYTKLFNLIRKRISLDKQERRKVEETLYRKMKHCKKI